MKTAALFAAVVSRQDNCVCCQRRSTVGYAGTDTPGVEVPYLRLRGRWLRDAGFVIGRHVKIEVDEGRMKIEQVD